QLGRDPRIEDVVGMEAVLAVEQAQVIVGVMEDDLDRQVSQDARERLEGADGQGIDHRRLRAGRYLQQIDPVLVPVKACGLRVDRQHRLRPKKLGELLQPRGCLNQLHARLYSAFETSSRPAAISSSALESALKNSASGCGVPPIAASICSLRASRAAWRM